MVIYGLRLFVLEEHIRASDLGHRSIQRIILFFVLYMYKILLEIFIDWLFFSYVVLS